MRERLIAALLGVTVLGLVVFGVIRAYSLSGLVERQEARRLDRSATLVAAVLAERVAQGGEVTPEFLRRQLGEDERATYDGGGSRPVRATGSGLDGSDRAGSTVTRRVPGGGSLTLFWSSASVDDAVSAEMLRLVMAGIAAAALATVVGVVVARRLSRPFQDLAGVADEFGKGRYDVDVPRSPVPEADEIGAGMREAQREINGLVKRERSLSVRGSHQLRTPLTALRLELEDLALRPQTHPDVAAQLARALTELDRLGANVDELLDTERGQRRDATPEIDLSALVADTAQRWRSRVEAAGRELVATTPGQIAVRLPPGPVSQILDALIVSALRGGAGQVSLSVAALDTHVRIQLDGQPGTGLQPASADSELGQLGSRRDDVTVAEAGEIAAALGGYLRDDPDSATTFTLMLARPA